LDLQDALYRYLRSVSIAKADYLQWKAGQPPPIRVLDNPAVIGPEAAARIVLLGARVEDERLRSIVRSYTGTFRELNREGITVPDEVMFAKVDEAWELQRTANDRIGELLRSL
jgi:hypothetical protein